MTPESTCFCVRVALNRREEVDAEFHNSFRDESAISQFESPASPLLGVKISVVQHQKQPQGLCSAVVPRLWCGVWGWGWRDYLEQKDWGKSPTSCCPTLSLFNKPLATRGCTFSRPFFLHARTGNPPEDKPALCFRFYTLHAAR